MVPLCQSCLLARARKRTPNVKQTWDLSESEGALSRDRYEVDDFVSTDQFICRTPGCFPKGYGHESADHCFQGGTIYNDAASGLIWVENQVSLGANETVMGKSCFEQWLWDMAYVEVKHYHGDNDSVVSSVYSQHSESEGEFRDDDNYDGFVHIPQAPLAPNIVNEGAGPNLFPEGDKSIQAPGQGLGVPCILHIVHSILFSALS